MCRGLSLCESTYCYPYVMCRGLSLLLSLRLSLCESTSLLAFHNYQFARVYYSALAWTQHARIFHHCCQSLSSWLHIEKMSPPPPSTKPKNLTITSHATEFNYECISAYSFFKFGVWVVRTWGDVERMCDPSNKSLVCFFSFLIFSYYF